MRSSSSATDKQLVVKTACGFCFLNCGINVYVEDGRIVRVDGMSEHPANEGRICVKSRQAADLAYSDDRLKYPMKKENGEWKRISWEEALDTITTKLRECKETYGASSLGVFCGDPMGVTGPTSYELVWTFCDLYGTPMRLMPGQLCGLTHMRAYTVTFGKILVPDLLSRQSKCILLWGHDPHNSEQVLVRPILDAKERGAKLVVIDPRRTPFAKRADVHVQPRPGTDGALALGMLDTIISEGLYDREFVEKWTVGFDRLADHVRQYPAEKVQRITGVAAEDIRRIARIYASNKPACIKHGICTLEQTASGFQNLRALSILQAITGNVDIPGGWARPGKSIPTRPIRRPEDVVGLKLIGADKYPLVYEVGGRMYGEGQAVDWADVVLTGKPFPVTTMIISGGNPAVTWPNSTKVRQALEQLDFLVVMDLFMTATAEMADMVLPTTTFLERMDVIDVYNFEPGTPCIMLRRPVIQPLWESWTDAEFWCELGRRMGYAEHFPWKNNEEIVNYFLEPAGLTAKQLEGNPLVLGSRSYGEYKKKGWRTPSGKIELYSEKMKHLGYDPLPSYEEPPESPVSTPELAKEYPLVLTTGARVLEYWHSQHRNLPGLRRRVPDPTVEIHPDTAAKYGIGDDEWVIVETKRGSIEVKARVTEDIMPDVVSIPHGWAQGDVNVLTDDTPADRVSGYPALKGLLCSVRKKAISVT